MKIAHKHEKGMGNLFAFSVSFSKAFGMIGFDAFEHSLNITLWSNIKRKKSL